MENEVASGIPESREAVTKAAESAEIGPATVIEMVEEATTLLSELPAKLMLEVVGAVVSARFKVLLTYTMPWLLTLDIHRQFDIFLDAQRLFLRLVTPDEFYFHRRKRFQIL